MKDLLTEVQEPPCVGCIVRTTTGGKPLVDFPGNSQGLVEARSIVDLAGATGNSAWEPIQVLLLFEKGDPALPIIVGILCESSLSSGGIAVMLDAGRPLDAVIDGRKVSLSANEEAVLRCGRSSIVLRSDGRILIKGTEIVSRSSGTQKIQGASIKLN